MPRMSYQLPTLPSIDQSLRYSLMNVPSMPGNKLTAVSWAIKKKLGSPKG
jgi:hypothetical protein